jgi:very-short-patch-repair endonuclease
MLAKEIWEYDKIKIQTAMKHGYLVLTIWESDYNENKEEIIKKCIDFLVS